MDYKEHIGKAVEYIEENLTNDIDLASCAKACGYSEYHFLRVFKEVSGITPADYIRKRRLSEIAKRICQNSLKLYEPLSSEEKTFCLIPEIITIPSFSLTVYKSDEDDPPKFWNKYNAKKRSFGLSGGKTCEDFGVSIWNHSEGKLDYFIGILTENAGRNIPGTQELHIPGGLYALFQTPITTHARFIHTIHSTWEYINTVWLPQGRYQRTGNYEFETYIEESRVFSEKIYIPIEVK